MEILNDWREIRKARKSNPVAFNHYIMGVLEGAGAVILGFWLAWYLLFW